jgi:hypothetical protein
MIEELLSKARQIFNPNSFADFFDGGDKKEPKKDFDTIMREAGNIKQPDGTWLAGEKQTTPTAPTPQPEEETGIVDSFRNFFANTAQASGEQAATTPQTTPMPQNNSGNASDEIIRSNILAGINDWNKANGSRVPITDNIDLFVRAAKEFQAKGMDPYLPVILALRETQGGRDNEKGGITGKNNVFNIRGQQGGATKFVDYPSLEVAMFGGQNGQDVSQGLTKLITENDIYSDYQNTKDIKDLYKKWSPPEDNNGELTEQEQNYNFFRTKFPNL